MGFYFIIFLFTKIKSDYFPQVKKEMREKGIDRSQAMDLVRLQRLIDVCDTKENTALYLLQDWNYEPQVP